jgi:hypothetical protein
VSMTALQQALSHLFLVLIAVVAIVVLQVTGNLTTVAAGFVLAITGFGNIGVAGLPTTTPAPVPVTPTPAPAKSVVLPPST